MNLTSIQLNDYFNVDDRNLRLNGGEVFDYINLDINTVKHVELTHFNFHDTVNLNFHNTNHFVLNFSGSVFENSLIVNIRHDAIVELNLSNCIFKNGFNITSNSIRTKIIAIKSKSFSEVNIDSSRFAILNFEKFQLVDNLDNCHFYFNGSSVEEEFSFKDAILNNGNFSNSVFNCNANFDGAKLKSAEFYSTIFNKDLYFNGTEFSDYIFLNGSIFNKTVIFYNCNKDINESQSDFSGAFFKGEVYFNYSYFNKVTFKNCLFENLASFKDSLFINVEFERCFFSKGADFSNTKYPFGDRESFRLIRSELLKVNNKFESLYYHSKELLFYEKDLTLKKNFGDKFMLWLNRVSTNHGLNWIKGLFFTIIIAIFFYFIYLIALPERPFAFGWESWESFSSASDKTLKYFFKFLLLTHDFDFMSKYSPNSFNYLIDFISKIFIGYGIYQTIQAFRKFGKMN